MNFRCPVCLFAALPYPPADYHICPCCGTEFGNDDDEWTVEQLRERWIASGADWFYEGPPVGWSAVEQLLKGGYGAKPSGRTNVAASTIRFPGVPAYDTWENLELYKLYKVAV